MIVYRVEHGRGGFGPYFGAKNQNLSPAAESLRAQVIRDHWDEGHPHPAADGLRDIQPDEYSCFATPASLGEWFNGDSLDLLRRAGFDVFSYEVDEAFVREGGRQALFLRRLAVRLDAMDLTAL